MVDHGDDGRSAYVSGLYTATSRGVPMRAHMWVDVLPGVGVAGDRYATGRGYWSDSRWPDQEVTLVEGEVADDLAIDAGQLRRNIVTRGVRLTDLIGVTFQLGRARLVGIRRCAPCRYLDRQTRPGLCQALRNQGGVRAHILQGGRIYVADRLTVVDASMWRTV